MNLRKLTLATLSLVLLSFSCNRDDDQVIVPDRDRQEVYDEDIVEIEEYLSTHFYNYEDFDETNPYSLANDEFELVFDTIEGINASKTPLIDQVTFKTVTENGVEYKLYILNVREGLNKNVHGLDRAAVNYNGTLVDGTSFDSAVTPAFFNLTTVGSQGGVVTGFREGLTAFKTADSFTEAADGSVVYHNHGIGAVFIPSGLGYFSRPVGSIPQYAPIFFRFNVYSRSNTDFDLDGIPSYLEDLSMSGDGLDDNTDGDLLVNFIDNDDDGDGVLTRDEVEKKAYTETPFSTEAEAQTYFDNNAAADEVFVSINRENNGTYILNTVIVPNTNNTDSPDLPDYLDDTVTNNLSEEG